MDEIPYFLRGWKKIPTESSVLVSSSRYLNDSRLRNWVAQETLRRNGRDLPIAAPTVEGAEIVNSVQDKERINALFAAQRRKWPELDRWFSERHIANYTKEELKHYPVGSLGHTYWTYLVEWSFDVDFGQDKNPKTDYDFWLLRHGQNHDIEHLITGGGYDCIGEAVPDVARIANTFRYLDAELAGEVNVLVHLFMTTMLSRTLLHYPETLVALWESMERGWKVGMSSGPYFMAKYEDLFPLPVAEARAKLGMRNVAEVDTMALSDIWGEGAMREARPDLFKAAE